ncbi:MAG: multicopper oxidase domain-containing protein [Gammaproteobacteria bacterium]
MSIAVKKFKNMRAWQCLSLFILNLLWFPYAFAADRTVNLVVSNKTVNFAGKPIKAIAVNNQIPGPTLHFKEGDNVTINVYNHLSKGTTIHWHGLLVPWQMDGVEGVTQKAIPPGGVFHYQFTLKQSGTYWYHSHAGFQEQQGLYGAIIIDPLQPPPYHYSKDYVIVLSDWSNTAPTQIYANLKKEGDFYSSKFPLQPSLSRFISDYREANFEQRQKLMSAYKMMQLMRMSIYDISDVAYDAFLLNGQPTTHPWTAPVKVGDVVRLRFIGAGANTIFHVKIPDTAMKMVHMQGHDVQPYTLTDFTIAPGETDDVLVKIQKPSPYIIYAESADTLGAAYGALINYPQQKVDYQQVKPFPIPEPVTMGHGMMMGGMMHHGSSMMNMGTTVQTSGTKYQNLKSLRKTNNPNKPVHVIKMVLSGYMDRYIWFINGLPEYKAKPIMIEPGKRYRLIFINESMMHHPMHIHGHFFILRNGHGAYDPFLHTIDVPPGATAIADFDADTSGQWLFHCHLLYHMMAGMARVFRYTTFSSNQDNDDHPMGHHPPGLYLANFLDAGVDPFHNVQEASFKSLFGSDYNKLQLNSEDAEIEKGTVEDADIDIFYWHLISQFWAIKGGVNYFYQPAQRPYWQPGIGIEGLMPYFIDTDIRTYFHNGSEKLDIQLARDTQITNRFFVRLGIRSILASKTVAADEVGSGLNQMRYILRPYIRLNPNLALFVEYENQQDFGMFKSIRRNLGESISENTVTFGVSLLF